MPRKVPNKTADPGRTTVVGRHDVQGDAASSFSWRPRRVHPNRSRPTRTRSSTNHKLPVATGYGVTARHCAAADCHARNGNQAGPDRDRA